MTAFFEKVYTNGFIIQKSLKYYKGQIIHLLISNETLVVLNQGLNIFFSNFVYGSFYSLLFFPCLFWQYVNRSLFKELMTENYLEKRSLIGSTTGKFKDDILWNDNHDFMWLESLKMSCPFPKAKLSPHTNVHSLIKTDFIDNRIGCWRVLFSLILMCLFYIM